VKLISFGTLKWFCLATLLAVFSPSNLLACAVCYGESDAPMARGVTWAILALGAIIACVLSGVAVFIVHLKRKSSELNNGSDPGAESV
jgi:hypothetical protein